MGNRYSYNEKGREIGFCYTIRLRVWRTRLSRINSTKIYFNLFIRVNRFLNILRNDEVSDILQVLPKLIDKFDISQLRDWDIMYILKVQPQLFVPFYLFFNLSK